MTQPFALRIPPLAGSIWLRSDFGAQKTFVVGPGVAPPDIAAEWLTPGVDCVFQLILPSGRSIRRELTYSDSVSMIFSAKLLAEDAFRKMGWLDFWGMIAPEEGDTKRLFSIRTSGGSDEFLELQLPAPSNRNRHLSAYRVSTADSRLRLETDSNNRLLTVRSISALPVSGDTAAVELIPTTSEDSSVDVEVIREPCVGSTFCRYLDVDANDGARIIGKHILYSLNPNDATPSTLHAAGLYCLVFGSRSESRHLLKLSSLGEAGTKSATREFSELRWIFSILNIRNSKQSQRGVTKDNLLDLLSMSRTNLPSCSIVLAYAARLIQELAEEHPDEQNMSTWVEEYKRWRPWIQDKGVDLCFESSDGLGPVAQNVRAGDLVKALISKKKELTPGKSRLFWASINGIKSAGGSTLSWRPWAAKSASRPITAATPMRVAREKVAPNLRLYELVFLARPELSAAELESICASFRTLIEEFQGKVVKVEKWGLRSLAYKIKGNRRAHYVLFGLAAPTNAIVELERRMGISEEIIRFLTVSVEKLDDAPSPAMKSGDDERPVRVSERRELRNNGNTRIGETR